MNFVIPFLLFFSGYWMDYIENDDPTMKSAPFLLDGRQTYMQHCVVCHQKDGKGIKPLYPPLTDLNWLKKPDQDLINIILAGQQGAIKVNGDSYNMKMPPMDYLDDREVAEVLNFIRTRFGNLDSNITSSAVKKVRSNLKTSR